MGRQTAFHMFTDDCKQFLDFVQERDPVVVVNWTSKSPEIHEIQQIWEEGGWYCLWNKSLLESFRREFIPESDLGAYYRVDSALPVIEFSYPSPIQEPWNGRPVHVQGRIWAAFENQNKEFDLWYNAVVRWIRNNFVKNPVPLLGGYIGPVAYNWFKSGGLLLPMFRPPLTSQWLSWARAQDQYRAVFSK